MHSKLQLTRRPIGRLAFFVLQDSHFSPLGGMTDAMLEAVSLQQVSGEDAVSLHHNHNHGASMVADAATSSAAPQHQHDVHDLDLMRAAVGEMLSPNHDAIMMGAWIGTGIGLGSLVCVVALLMLGRYRHHQLHGLVPLLLLLPLFLLLPAAPVLGFTRHVRSPLFVVHLRADAESSTAGDVGHGAEFGISQLPHEQFEYSSLAWVAGTIFSCLFLVAMKSAYTELCECRSAAKWGERWP